MYNYDMKYKMTFMILFSLLFFNSKSYGKWEWVSGSTSLGGVDIYIDFQRIMKKNGYIYFWYLMNWEKINNPKGNSSNYHSFVVYSQGDCNLFKFKQLSVNTYFSQMGKNFDQSFTPKDEWKYPTPKSNFEGMLKSVCNK